MKYVKEVVEVAAELGNTIDEVVQNGLEWKDLLSLPKMIALTPKIVDVVTHLGATKDELASLTPEEVTELKTYFDEKFDIKEDGVEKVVEASIGILLQFKDAAVNIVTLAKSLKK